MNLHEYQAKALMAANGVAVPKGIVVATADAAVKAAAELGTEKFVVKAQVHAGGRGKAGGVKIVDTKEAAGEATAAMLGTQLVTYQTDEKGQPVNQVLIETPSDIDRELYLSFVIDRSKQRVVVMASQEGGVEIEKIAEESPEKIHYHTIDPLLGVMPFQGRSLAFALGLKGTLAKQFLKMLAGLYKMFMDNDLAQLEINPLVVTKQEELICLDGKINLDESALYRHPALVELNDPLQEDARETEAKKWELNYIALDGDIGCMVNGAGLAMATMDLIKLYGGSPANFLDVGGGATKERVTEAFKIILSDDNVKAVLVNIFGGIVRCDLIADGIIAAVAEVDIKVPVVVRLQGNNAELGSQKLAESGLNIVAVKDFSDAAEQVVKLANGEQK